MENLSNLISDLQAAKSALFITGAGISIDSGLPTYRGVGGLYNSGTTDEGMPIEEILSRETLRTRPELCWKHVSQLAERCLTAKPNIAHETIAALEDKMERCWVMTQNIDGLHRSAGGKNVIEIHGTGNHVSCISCDWSLEGNFRSLDTGTQEEPKAPVCPVCGSLVRPDVVLFDEPLPEQALATLDHQIERGFDLVVMVGTTGRFPYITMPVLVANEDGKTTVEINPQETDVSSIFDYHIRGTASDVFRALREAVL